MLATSRAGRGQTWLRRRGQKSPPRLVDQHDNGCFEAPLSMRRRSGVEAVGRLVSERCWLPTVRCRTAATEFSFSAPDLGGSIVESQVFAPPLRIALQAP